MWIPDTEEHVTSFFRVEMCRVRNHLDYSAESGLQEGDRRTAYITQLIFLPTHFNSECLGQHVPPKRLHLRIRYMVLEP
jgi:hypothetical protein